MTDHNEIVRLKEKSEIHDELIKELRKEVSSDSKRITAMEVKHDELTRRHVTHSERHENNYQKLEAKFGGLDEKLSQVLSRLDSNSGRDAVYKFLLGSAVTALIGGATTYIIFGGM